MASTRRLHWRDCRYNVSCHGQGNVSKAPRRIPTKKIELSAVAEIQASLRHAPPRPQTHVRYAKAIELMASDIHAMRARGYGWNDIAAMLADMGLQLSATTIQEYVRRVGGNAPEASTGRKRRRGEGVRATSTSTPRERSQASVAHVAQDTPNALGTSSPPPRPTASTPVAKPLAATSPFPERHAAEDVPRWSFPVRPDTKDL